MDPEFRDFVLRRNRESWNAQVARGNRWTIPVGSKEIETARRGNVQIVLTPKKFVPRHWFPPLDGCRTLMLASGGGQQSPILAAAGAVVTVVDLSDAQLEQDRLVAQRESLTLRTIQSSMDDLSMLESNSFDLVIHPCSNSFAPKLESVWAEVARVTRPGGVLMAGFCNPLMFLFDENDLDADRMTVSYSLPYSDLKSLSQEKQDQFKRDDEPLMFGHTLTDQIGGQLDAGFAMVAMYEDVWGGDQTNGFSKLDQHTASFMATRCIRLGE